QTPRTRDGIVIDPEITQKFVGICEPAARQRHVHYQFSIPRGFTRHIKPAGFQKRSPPEKGSLLPEETSLIRVTAQVDSVRRAMTDTGAAILIDEPDGAAEHVDIGTLLKIVEDIIERAAGEAVVGVQVAQNAGVGGGEA